MSTDESTSIDVGSWFATLARNWWVIVGLIVIGIVVGAAVTMAQPKQYTATASVYIGQTTDANGNAMAGLNSNAKAAVQLLASQVVLNAAAERAGMDISASLLRKETTVETPSSTVKTTTSVVNIVVISVTDTKKARAAAAANALAEVLLERLESGVDEKIALARDAARRRAEGVRGGHGAQRRRAEGPRRHRRRRRLGRPRRRRPSRRTWPSSRRAATEQDAARHLHPEDRSSSCSWPSRSSSRGCCTKPASPTRRAARA